MNWGVPFDALWVVASVYVADTPREIDRRITFRTRQGALTLTVYAIDPKEVGPDLASEESERCGPTL